MQGHTPGAAPSEDSMLLSASTRVWSHGSHAARRLLVLSRHLSAASGSQGYEYDLLVVGGGSGGLACSKEGRWTNIITPMSS